MGTTLNQYPRGEEEMEARVGKIKETSHWWWFDSHHIPRRSPWLHSTLAELDKKTKSMLRTVEEDADSFAQRAEMYYKKRPELISMVEDFYRMHRSLAERYDQLRSDMGLGCRVSGSPFAAKYGRSDTFSGMTDQISDSHSEVYDPDDGAKSEVEDFNPEHEDEREDEDEQEDVEIMPEFGVHDKTEEVEAVRGMAARELVELREELERVKQEKSVQMEQLLQRDEERRQVIKELREELESVKQENMVQRDQLLQKDEEKREVIRQLTSAMEMIKLESIELRKALAHSYNASRKTNSFQFEKLKEAFLERVFYGCAPKSRGAVVAL